MGPRKKKWNDMTADVAQCKRNNIKRTLQLLVIYRYRCRYRIVLYIYKIKRIHVLQNVTFMWKHVFI